MENRLGRPGPEVSIRSQAISSQVTCRRLNEEAVKLESRRGRGDAGQRCERYAAVGLEDIGVYADNTSTGWMIIVGSALFSLAAVSGGFADPAAMKVLYFDKKTTSSRQLLTTHQNPINPGSPGVGCIPPATSQRRGQTAGGRKKRQKGSGQGRGGDGRQGCGGGSWGGGGGGARARIKLRFYE